MKPKPTCPYGTILDKKLKVCRPVTNDEEWLEMIRHWELK